MKTLEELTKDLENIEDTKDSRLFHKVMGDIFTEIGFKKNYDSYGIAVRTWNYDNNSNLVLGQNALSGFNFEQIGAINFLIENSKFPVDYFTRTENFVKENSFFDIVTFYKNFLYLREGIYNSKFIISNSEINFTKNIIDFNNLKRNHPHTKEEELLDLILKNNGILKKGDLYFFGPRSILELYNSQPTVMYAKIINNH